jgi:predicted metalloprotease
MRIDRSRRSTQIEDRRGLGPARGPGLKLGLGGTLLALVAAYFLGIDPRMILGLMQATQTGAGADPQAVAPTGTPTDAGGEFVAAVLGDTEDTWSEIFAGGSARYRPPTLVLFEQRVASDCGIASSGAGPFYCPKDEKIYIDLMFFRELESQFQAPGDFARAYVLAHEVGHHVQHLLGTLENVRSAQQRAAQTRRNQLQVMVELQADCYAGIWAHHANRSRQILENGDVEEALGAASAVGDDTIQRRVQGEVVPESFTHGSALQRVEWFRRGLEAGALTACDTFAQLP